MFYSQFILAKKGPLGTIWIAAHLERKLRKNQVADTDIGVSVDSILSPDVPIALRLSSHLLLGVVRIYNRKVNYLFDDCSEALLKVKQAFRSTAVDLPPEQSKAPYHSITLPETFDLDDFELPDSDAFQGNYVDHHVSSREQITLQDTMDGVALSTSRFGLDERFGDADTSGVDLDEELFLNKVGTSGNVDVSDDPQSSVLIMAPVKQDHHDVVSPNLEPLIDGVDEDVDPMDDAQAPRTPGLLEEPNLSNAQERSACEDHFETEEHHLTEATMKDDLEKIIGEKNPHEQTKHVDDCSITDRNSVTVIPMASEDGHNFTDIKLQGVACEEKSLDNHSSSVSELAELRHEEIADNKKDNVDFTGSVGDNERSDKGGLERSTHDLCGSANIGQQVLQNVPTSSENIEHVNEDSQEKAKDQTYKEHKILSLDSNASNVDEQYQVLVPCNANQGSNPKDHQCVDPKPSNENGTLSPVQVSRAGDTMHGFDMSGVAQGNVILDGSEDATLEGTSRDPALEGPSHGAGGMSSAVDNVASIENPLENVYSSGSPEKLRSVTDGADNHPGSLNMDYTPGYLVTNNEGDAGSNFISGKKRTYTESTLTEQSLYTVESSGISHSKRTVESIPDDGDLLSSILAGRKTSVLKVKPTPSPRETTSVKRRRSAGTNKRKVLIDDSMVLHGDTIRRQLMNTEDIRRARKKAPCTRPEITMIQKQFLAEEMFVEPICSGLSTELGSLHTQTHDLGGIVITVDDVDCAFLELGTNGRPKYYNDMLSTEEREGSSARDVVRSLENGSENEGLMVQDICEQETIAGPAPVDAHNGNCISSLHDNVIESELKTTIDVEVNQSLLELPEDIVDTEFDGRPGSVTDVVNTTDAESSLPSELVSGGYVDVSADLALVAPSYEARTPDLNIIYGDAAWHNDATHQSDQKADEVSLETTPPCEMGVEGNDLGKDFSNVTAAEFVTDEQLLKTAEGNATVETEGCINSREKDDVVDTIANNEIEQTSSFPMDMDLHMEDVFLDGGKFPCQEDGDYPVNMPEMDHLVCDYADISGSVADNETEFLNLDDDDDDELVEATDDHIPKKDASFTDNSGWSSRTRAVANYLQRLFVKQGGNTRRTLAMDNLLAGKTRKEASRMFFEALVLKTKDYIDVEQAHPFDNISLRPQMELMKSEF